MATAIAHFTLPPNRRVSTTEQVGVVAFAKGGITRVDFQINGGVAVPVTTRTKVTDTDVKGKTVTHYEYQLEFDPSLHADGAVTIDALVVGTTATNRQLTQITLHANSGGTLDGNVLTVNSSENAGGAGTYDTLKAAFTASSATGGDIIELLQEGTYLTDDASFQLDSSRNDLDYWTTVRGASGLNLQNVILSRSTFGGARSKYDRIKYEHLAFDLDKISIVYCEDVGYTAPRIGGAFWLHDVYVTDALGWANPRSDGQDPPNAVYVRMSRDTNFVDGMWVTDSEAYDCVFGFAGATFQRNCHQRRISSDAFKGDLFVLNASVYEMDGSTRTLIDRSHADLCQVINTNDNVLFYNVECANLVNVQGIHFDETGGSFANMAFVNYSAQINDSAEISSILGAHNHTLMYQVSIPEQRLGLRNNDVGQPFSAIDFDVQNSVFDAISNDTATVESGVTVDNCHTITTAVLGGYGSGNTQSAVDMADSGVLGSWTYTGVGLTDITESGGTGLDIDFPNWDYSSATVPNKGSWPQSAWEIVVVASLFDPNHEVVSNATSLVSFDVIDANGAPYDDAAAAYWTADTTNGATVYAKETINSVTQLARQDIDEAGIAYQAPATGLDPDTNAWWFMMSYNVIAAPTASGKGVFSLANTVRDASSCFNLTSQSATEFHHWIAGGFRFTATPVSVGTQHFVIYKYDGVNAHDYYDSEYGSWRSLASAPGSNGDTLSSFWLGTGWNAELPASFEYLVGAVGYAPSFATMESLVADPYQVFLSGASPATGFTNTILKNITSSIVKDITQ